MTHTPASTAAVFLDRDGTLNVDRGYIGNPDDVVLLPHVLDALTILKDLGFLTIIISNQSGVARGYFKREDLKKVDARLKSLLNHDRILLDDSFYCTDHPEFTRECDCRKPKIGLVKQAVQKYTIDIKKSFFIGDRDRDIACGNAAGCTTIHLLTNEWDTSTYAQRVKADFSVKSLTEAADLIKRFYFERT